QSVRSGCKPNPLQVRARLFRSSESPLLDGFIPRQRYLMSSIDGPDPSDLLGLARDGDTEALGRLLELYRNYLSLLARVEIGRRLQSKVDPGDLVQDTFLEAQRDFAQFQGTTEKELAGWLRQILISNLLNLVRHYLGTQQRDVRLERALAADVDSSSQMLEKM